MRTLFVSLCFVLTNVVPSLAADDSGPRLLENQTYRRPTQTTSTAASIRVDVNMALVPVTGLDPRKALIVVSDGGDNNSRYTLRELAAIAAEADVQIFSICLFDKPQTVEEVDGPALLSKLTQASGGINYMIADVREMKTAFSRVGVTLHNQYVLGYYPPEDAPCGKYRKIT